MANVDFTHTNLLGSGCQQGVGQHRGVAHPLLCKLVCIGGRCARALLRWRCDVLGR